MWDGARATPSVPTHIKARDTIRPFKGEHPLLASSMFFDPKFWMSIRALSLD